jgi:hypothetical protein
MDIKVDSNNVGAAIAEELTLKTLPGTPVWYEMEPNSFSDFGSDVKTVARTPIKKGRQRKKGVVVDLDASGALDMDVTDTFMRRVLQGFMFANARQKPSTRPLNGTAIALTAAASADKSVSAASGLTIIPVGRLVKLTGFASAVNQGLRTVATSATGKLTFAENMADETPSALAEVEVVGVQCATGDITVAVTATNVTLGSTVLDFTTLGLDVGEYVFVGGDTAITTFALNQPGYARISAIAAHALQFDDTTWTPAVDTGSAKTIQLFFGTAIRNETTDVLLVRKTYQLERQLGADGSGTQSEYLTGAMANELTINLAEASKVDANLSFIALDAETRTTVVGVKAGTRIAAVAEDAYNTSSNLFRAKISIGGSLNATPLFAYGSELKLSIKNNIKALKALAVLGAFEASAGSFEVSATMEAYFSDVTALAAVRNNNDVALNLIAAHNKKGFIFDMPLTALGGGKLKVEKDNPIKLSLNIDAAECANGYTLFTVFFPYLPTAAMPK